MKQGDLSLVDACTRAALVIGAIYDHVDKIEALGGTTSIAGIASCHAFINSLKKNKQRTTDLVLGPLKAALEKE